MSRTCRPFAVVAAFLMCLLIATTAAAQSTLKFQDLEPQQYKLTARASKIDLRVKAHPEIDFLIEGKMAGRPILSTLPSIREWKPRGKLVIWLMGHNEPIVRPPQFLRSPRHSGALRQPLVFHLLPRKPVGEHCRGNIRLEAATGQDFSDEVDIPKPDGMMERAFQFVKWLAKENPQAGWSYFLTDDGQGLRWDDVIISGSSHGSTTAARFAKFQKVSRVVAFCGPRDQHQSWQSLPSATPENRYFGFSHVLDGGWTADHYCRSWEVVGDEQVRPHRQRR